VKDYAPTIIGAFCFLDAPFFLPPKLTPESVAHSLELAGGLNRFREPNYRAIWGWNRLAWIGGKFEERDPTTHADGRRAHRARNRMVAPPSAFSREARPVDREQRQERSYDAYAYDILDDAVPAFHRQPFVTVV
jgi:hypothetical protein